MFKLTICIFLVFAPVISTAQSETQRSLKFDLDQFSRSLILESDSLTLRQDSIPSVFYRSREGCAIESKRDSLFQLIEQLRSFDQGTNVDTTQSYKLLFDVELHISSSQFILENHRNEGWYCIHTESKYVSGKSLVSHQILDDIYYHDCFQFTHAFSDSFLVITKNCVKYGNMTDFHTSFVRFYELVPRD